MSGYSYFNYDQMTLLEVEVHSDDLELLHQAADEYDWKAIQTEIEPKFKEAAWDFRYQKPSSMCPHKDDKEADLQERFPFLETLDATESVAGGDAIRNPKGAGRKGQDFLSYLKAFLLAPVLRVEQNSLAIAAAIAGNPAFYVACGFTAPSAARTLRDFDQIMCDSGLWEVVHQLTYEKNVEDKVIDETIEDTLNIDNTHVLGYSTPGKSPKRNAGNATCLTNVKRKFPPICLCVPHADR